MSWNWRWSYSSWGSDWTATAGTHERYGWWTPETPADRPPEAEASQVEAPSVPRAGGERERKDLAMQEPYAEELRQWLRSIDASLEDRYFPILEEHYDTLSQIKRVYLFHDESGPHLDAQFFEDNHIDRPHQQLFRAALERGLSRLDRAVSAVSATSELPEKEGPATAGDAANAGSAAMDAATEAASDAWKKEWSKEDWWRWNNWSPGWNTWSSGWNTWSSGWNSW
ncbi:unnamed protein product [Durusdinium trenchii]|uniref:SAP domain-containing protein n=2 Tax=Durusdinium trenchii TaxID=1381693 RepID=A0ABP0KVI7_9DINO